MKKAAMERSRKVSEEIQRVYDSMRESPFTQFKRAFRSLEAELLHLAKNEFERSEVRRRISEHLLLGAHLRDEPFEQVKRVFRELQALGFRYLDRRVFAVCLLARSAADTEAIKQKELAAKYLNDTLARVHRLPKRGHARPMLQESLFLAAKTLGVELRPVRLKDPLPG